MTQFNEISLQWLKYKKNTISFTTWEMYKTKVEKLNQHFGEKNIKDIKIIEIQDYIDGLYIYKTFSKSTIQKYKITLSMVYNFSVKLGIIDINPISSITIPKIQKKLS